MSDSHRVYFRGYALIRINQLQLQTGRDLNDKHVARLRKIFKLEGCLHYDHRHSVPVVINENLLLDALNRQHPGLHQLPKTGKDAPALRFAADVQIACLHGRHRIAAAEQILGLSDQWWIVEVFSDDMPIQQQRDIQQDHGSSLGLTHDVIFRYILMALKRDDKVAYDKWYNRLQDDQKKIVRRLRGYTGGALLKIFEDLASFSLEWDYFCFGRLALIMEAKCEEEVCQYLRTLHTLWIDILGPTTAVQDLDETTVKLLRLKMPAHSTVDAEQIQQSLRDGKLFRNVHDLSERKALEARLLKCPRFITLETFFKDAIYLKACSDGLNKLLPSTKSGAKPTTNSLRASLAYYFNDDMNQFPLRYMQLWFYALRNFPYIEDRKFNAPRADADSTSTSLRLRYNSDFDRLARHALSLGFSLEKRVRHDASNTNANDFDSISSEKPALSTNDEGLPDKERSNRPCERSFHRNRGFITLENVMAIYPQPCGAYPTPFAVTRDMVFRFWGDILPPSDSSTRQRNAQHESEAQDLPAPGESDTRIYRPSSSDYERSTRSPSAVSEVRPKTFGQGEGWNEGDFSSFYMHPHLETKHPFVSRPNVLSLSETLTAHEPAQVEHTQTVVVDQNLVEDRRRALRISSASSRSTNLFDDGYEKQYPAEDRASKRANGDDLTRQMLFEAVGKQQPTESVELEDQPLPADDQSLETVQTQEPHAQEERNRWWQLSGSDCQLPDPEQQIQETAEVVGTVYDDDAELADSQAINALHARDQAVSKKRHRYTRFPGGPSKREGQLFNPGQVAHLGINVDKDIGPPPEQDTATTPNHDGQTTTTGNASSEPEKENIQHEHSSTKLAVSSKHKTTFPGPASQTTRHHGNNLNVSSLRTEDNRRRKRQDHDDTVFATKSATHEQAQVPDFDVFKIQVESVRSIWDQLDNRKIYVTSPVDVPGLDSKRHTSHDRLWSWAEHEHGEYRLQLDRLLEQNYGFQLISSEGRPGEPHYRTAPPESFWQVYFGTAPRIYWLAVIYPLQEFGGSRGKVRKTELVRT
ncbi:hypothetical protein M409DRAFT_61391 [Zasmidium cellare ATCC 36951]|uniref:Uncharacterized protein n=1 Tax=Zasmidium cellare ATCC 36951 TaxID=1080233 RepID=A0A6A6BVZ6_ZASCE|nr:uncharacterized protein M409DRAFT_61391 [Zasmidium cellare ATCC 36951]KAF2158733.1 hypothetical protein M409DRAFT_61391 [Zasmidium cellare ATCC 36951]